MTLFDKARNFALQRHKDQTYDGGSFVVNHLDQVVIVLLRFGETRQNLLAAAMLHDVIEDTDTTLHELDIWFGSGVSSLVWAVTDEEGRNRKERKEKTLAKLRNAEGDAVKVKLADRIANVEASLRSTEKSLFGMYRKEHALFKAVLFKIGEHEEMWAYLDSLLDQDWVVK